MAVDEFAIRKAAEELQDLYARLDEAKHIHERTAMTVCESDEIAAHVV